MSRTSNLLKSVPPSLQDFFGAMNASDEAALIKAFADDALVNDQLRDFRGKAEIASWIRSEVTGETMRAVVTCVTQHFGDFLVNAHVSGDFDTTGLPDPLELCFHFGLRDGLIVTLYILRKLPPQSSPEMRVPVH